MPRRTSSVPARAQTVLHVVLRGLTYGALATLVVIGLVAGTRAGDHTGSPISPPVAGTDRTTSETSPPGSPRLSGHPCVQHGFEPASPTAAGPTYALVRQRNGRVRVVSFARAWEVHQGRRPGRLVAVCQAPGA